MKHYRCEEAKDIAINQGALGNSVANIMHITELIVLKVDNEDGRSEICKTRPVLLNALRRGPHWGVVTTAKAKDMAKKRIRDFFILGCIVDLHWCFHRFYAFDLDESVGRPSKVSVLKME